MINISIITLVNDDLNGLRATYDNLQQYKDYSLEWILCFGNQRIDSTYPREEWIVYHRVMPDLNIGSICNELVNVARGAYLLFLNAGTRIQFPNSQFLCDLFQSREDMIWGNIVSVDKGYSYEYPQRDDFSMFYLIEHPIPLQSTFINKEVFERLGGFDNDNTVTFDFAYFFKAIVVNQCSVRFVPQFKVCAKPFVSFELHPDRESEILKTVVSMYPRLVGDDNPQLRLPSEIHSAMKFWRFLQNNTLAQFVYNVFVKPFNKKH